MTGVEEFEVQARRVLEQTIKIAHPSFRKVLYLVMIDALAARRFPKMKVRERFTRFVREVGVWEYADRVSLPVAAVGLPSDDPATAEMRSFIAARLDAWTKNVGRHDADNDPTPNEFPDGSLDRLRPFQHVNLLWQFRNSLLHEFQEPELGDVWNIQARCPVYTIPGVEPEREPWHLVYPVDCLASLAEACLSNFLAWCRAGNVNPYGAVPRWLRRGRGEP